MNTFAVFLVLLSTFMHAGWNLLARKERAEAAFFDRMLLIVALAGAVPATASEVLAQSLPAKAWLCLFCTGGFCGLYYFSLARAYASSDFTAVYPVVRSLPIILVAAADVLRGRVPTTFGWIGILLVVGGCFLAPLRSLRELALRRYFNTATVWLLMTALGTAGYTVIDKIASELVVQGPASAARYGYFFFISAYAVYTLLRGLTAPKQKEPASMGWKAPAFGALFTYSSYWLILWAYQLSQRASYVVAFRQFSIVIGVVIAFMVYKEHGKAVRLAATFLITCGLVLIALLGG